MTKKTFFYIAFLLLSCNTGNVENKQLPRQEISTVSKFRFDPEESPLLFLQATINGKYPATFILDNGTLKDYEIIYDREFARNYLMKDTSFLAEIHFQNDSTSHISFQSFNLKCINHKIQALPKRIGLVYDGIIGLGILQNYLLEVNYKGYYFSLHMPFKPDTSQFEAIQLHKKVMCPQVDAVFFKNGKSFIRPILLDLGFGGKGFMWGGKAASQLSLLKDEYKNFKKDGVKMVGDMIGSTAELTFDSVVLFKNRVFKSNISKLVQSGSGLAMSNQVWFGNDIFKSFEKIYFDFDNDIIYLPK